MLRISLIQDVRVTQHSEVPVPAHFLCGKESLDDLTSEEYQELYDYVAERAGDFFIGEFLSDVYDEELVWEGACKPGNEQCKDCKARIDCVVDL